MLAVVVVVVLEPEPVEPVEVLEVPLLVVEPLVPDTVEGEVDGAPPVPTLLVPVPVDVPVLAITWVTTKASAANDTCLELNKAIWPVVAPFGTFT